MFERILAFLSAPEAQRGSDSGFEEAQVAAAALLVRAATIDADFADVDRQTIRRLVKSSGLSDEDVDRLIAEAESQESQTLDLFAWTQVVKNNFSAEERVELIEKMWEVAYADGVLDDFEANLLRRVAGLIYVPDRDSGAARRRVMARLGIEG